VAFDKRLETLHRHAAELIKAQSVEDVAEATFRAIRQNLGAQEGGFDIIEGDNLKFIYPPRQPDDVHALPLDGKDISIRAAKTGRTQLVPDTSRDEDFTLFSQGDKIESRSELDIPVKVEGEVVAVIILESDGLEAFSENDEKFLETLSMHVGAAFELTRQKERLERLVEEMTQELIDAERMVVAGRVSAMVGHDLRGPLQTIKNAAYLLRREEIDNGEALGTIEDAVRYATGLLEEIHNSTWESPLLVESTDLSQLIQRTIREMAVPPQVSVEFEIGRGLDAVSLDPKKMRRVLDNLTRNAIEAMEGGRTLMIKAKRHRDVVELIVEDTGTGIPEDFLPFLFKPFQTTKSRGMGLGLVYCKRVMEAYGGRIDVESEEGVGTTFTIIMPVSRGIKAVDPGITQKTSNDCLVAAATDQMR
jgi:signal transduction histidine kinase